MCVLYMIKVLSRKAFFPLRLLMLARKWKHLWSAAAAAAARICPLLLFSPLSKLAGWLISLKKKIKILLDYATKAAGRGDNDERDNRALHQWPLPWVGE